MDLDRLLHRHRRSLMVLDSGATDEERKAHSQFARDYAVRTGMVRTALGAPHAICGFSK